MRSGVSVLVVDADADYGRALAVVLRRTGGQVRVVRTRAQALQAAKTARFDLAVVDLFLGGGGVELARELARHVPRLMLSLAARLERGEILEAALGFPVHRKASLARLLRPAGMRAGRGARRPRRARTSAPRRSRRVAL
jgi:CheY-like chemotaxis protein